MAVWEAENTSGHAIRNINPAKIYFSAFYFTFMQLFIQMEGQSVVVTKDCMNQELWFSHNVKKTLPLIKIKIAALVHASCDCQYQLVWIYCLK